MGLCDYESVRLDLRRREIGGDVNGDLREVESLRSQQPRVAGDDNAVFIDDDCQPNSWIDAATLSTAR